MILEQHNIVTFRMDDRRVVYSIKPEDVLRLARSARCSFLVKTLYGEVAEAICEELVCQGRLSCSECLRRVSSRLDTPLSEVIHALLYDSYKNWILHRKENLTC